MTVQLPSQRGARNSFKFEKWRWLENKAQLNSTQLNSTRGWLNKGKEARKLKNIPDSLNDSQVFFWKYL